MKLTAIQSQLFHDRQQCAKETVDEYAEELKKLFAKAYKGLVCGGPEAENMGVLANQFIAGLRPDLKVKVVGTEGNLEQVLLKARFEQAKRRELAAATSTPQQKTFADSGSYSPNPGPIGTIQGGTGGTTEKSSRNCYNCGIAGHMMRVCPYPSSRRVTGKPVAEKTHQ